MNKRKLTRLEQGEVGAFLKQFYITPRQRKTALKWLLHGCATVLAVVLQNVIFSRVTLLGGTMDLVPTFILLIAILQGPGSGSVYALCASAFYCLSGAAMGQVGILTMTVGGSVLGAFRLAYFKRSFWSVGVLTALGVVLHVVIQFLLAVFLGLVTWQRFLEPVCTAVLSVLAYPAVYPLGLWLGRIGGQEWKE